MISSYPNIPNYNINSQCKHYSIFVTFLSMTQTYKHKVIRDICGNIGKLLDFLKTTLTTNFELLPPESSEVLINIFALFAVLFTDGTVIK